MNKVCKEYARIRRRAGNSARRRLPALGKNAAAKYIHQLEHGASALRPSAAPFTALAACTQRTFRRRSSMDIRFQNLGPEQWKGDVLLAPVCQDEALLEQVPELDKVAPWLVIAPALRDFKGKTGELALLHGHPDLSVSRVLAVGLGPREKVSTSDIRKAIAAAVQLCRKQGYTSIVLPEPALAKLPGGRERLVEECVCAAQLALYRFTALKKADADETADPQWMAVAFDGQEVPDAAQFALP